MSSAQIGVMFYKSMLVLRSCGGDTRTQHLDCPAIAKKSQTIGDLYNNIKKYIKQFIIFNCIWKLKTSNRWAVLVSESSRARRSYFKHQIYTKDKMYFDLSDFCAAFSIREFAPPKTFCKYIFEIFYVARWFRLNHLLFAHTNAYCNRFEYCSSERAICLLVWCGSPMSH